MSPMRIAFAGTSAFAVKSLEALTKDAAFEVSLVITQPDRPTGRGKTLTPPTVKVAAEKLKIHVEQPDDINLWIIAHRTWNIDFLVVVSYGQILSEDVLRWPRIAPVNVHASLLPRWRGASPIQHVILAGDRETGVTIQKIVRELDAGPILSQEHIHIGPHETFTKLHDRLAKLGAALLLRTLKSPLEQHPQCREGITHCRKFTRQDGIVDPLLLTAAEIHRRIRALSPWPGVTCTVAGKPLKIQSSTLSATAESIPLPCAKDTVLHLVSVQEAGKKPMSGSVWLRGKKRNA